MAGIVAGSLVAAPVVAAPVVAAPVVAAPVVAALGPHGALFALGGLVLIRAINVAIRPLRSDQDLPARPAVAEPAVTEPAVTEPAVTEPAVRVAA